MSAETPEQQLMKIKALAFDKQLEIDGLMNQNQHLVGFVNAIAKHHNYDLAQNSLQDFYTFLCGNATPEVVPQPE